MTGVAPAPGINGALGRAWGPARQTLRALLARHPVLGMSTGALEAVVSRVDFACWRPGQEVAASDDETAGLRLVVGGVVKIVCHGTSGGAVTVQLVGPGGLVHLAGIPPETVCRVEAVAHTPALVAVLPAGTWREVACHVRVDEALRLAEGAWQSLSRRLYEKCTLLTLPIRDRVLHELRALARDFGKPHPAGVCIEVRLSHADLASLIGAARANVTRALVTLRAEGVLAATSGRLVLASRA
jgi:CRP/FNR family transcriptional regulator, cyclic AMP receptor protein